MEEKSFDSITVTDITSAAGFNRLTFYYHFEDKYDLLNWIYYHEIILTFKNNLDKMPWNESLRIVLEIIRSEKKYYVNAFAYDNREFRKYMVEAVVELFMGLIGEWAGEQYVREEDIRFVSTFLAYGIVGLVVEWVESNMEDPPDEMIEYIRNLLEDIKLLTISRFLKNTFEHND